MRFKDFLRLTESALPFDGEQPDEFPPEYQPPKPPKIRMAPSDTYYSSPSGPSSGPPSQSVGYGSDPMGEEPPKDSNGERRFGYPKVITPDDIEARVSRVISNEPPRKLPKKFKMSPKNFKKRVEKLGVGEIRKMPKKRAKELGFTQDDGYDKKLSRLELRPTMTDRIPRLQMPQIKDREKYIRWLISNGVEVTREQMTPEELVRANKELLTAFAQERMYLGKSYRFITKDKVYDKMMIITQDKKIFDGNHHWLVSAAINHVESIPVYYVHMQFQELLEFTKNYPDVEYEEHWDELLGCYIGRLVFLESEYEDDYLF